MDNSKIIFLINDTVRAIRAVYEDDASAKKCTFKTFDQTLKVDDLVVVQSGTRHGQTVVKVLEIDVDIDFDSPIEMKWVVQKVDMVSFNNILAQEGQAIVAVNRAEKRRKMDELRTSLFKDHEASIQGLALANHSEGDVVQQPDLPHQQG